MKKEVKDISNELKNALHDEMQREAPLDFATGVMTQINKEGSDVKVNTSMKAAYIRGDSNNELMLVALVLLLVLLMPTIGSKQVLSKVNFELPSYLSDPVFMYSLVAVVLLVIVESLFQPKVEK